MKSNLRGSFLLADFLHLFIFSIQKIIHIISPYIFYLFLFCSGRTILFINYS